MVKKKQTNTDQNHPTCRAVLPLLEQAVMLIREKIESPATAARIRGASFAYAFLKVGSGPFARMTVMTLVQEAYAAGVRESSKWQPKE